MSRVLLGFAFATILSCAARVLGAGVPEVFDAHTGPDDRRLTEMHDVDHPVIFTPAFTDPAQWKARATQLRRQSLVAEGLWPLPIKTPLNAVVHGSIDRETYMIEKVFFASYPGHYVSGNLYRPKGRAGKLPVVLCPHGHWAGGRFYERTDKEAQKQIAEGAEQTMEGAKYPIQARCAMLAQMGCIVFHYDMVGYADSQSIEHRTGFTDAESILRLQSFMGLQTWNTIRALDFVTALPDVDPTRIGVTGASGGGTQTILAALVDDRPSVVFPAVMVSEAMQGGCICENAPLLRVGTNNVEMIGAFAPKPLAMSAANDWTIALETDGLPKLKTIYSLFGAKDNVMGKHFSFEHNYNEVSRELMYGWFNTHLKLGLKEPVKELPWKPVPPKELSVYDEQHPKPADTADAATLRKYMTESSDRLLDDLFKIHPDEYRQSVCAALSEMVHDDLPAPGDVVVGHASGPKLSDGVIMETGTLSRRDAGEAVPFVSLVPKDWNGTVVVWVHPDGKSSLFAKDDGSIAAQQVLDRKSAVICADLFQTGEFAKHQKPIPTLAIEGYSKQKYTGFLHAYNRGVLANRVHDLLSEIAFVRHWTGTKKICLIAFAKSGPEALIVEAMAGKVVDRACIDMADFDFDSVKDPHDPLLLPGALKYGGVSGLIPLCGSGPVLLTACKPRADRMSGKSVRVREKSMALQETVDWILSSE